MSRGLFILAAVLVACDGFHLAPSLLSLSPPSTTRFPLWRLNDPGGMWRWGGRPGPAKSLLGECIGAPPTRGRTHALSMTLSSGGEMVVPSEEQLLSAIKVIKRDHPEWGFRRVHEKIKGDYETWAVRDKRVRKLITTHLSVPEPLAGEKALVEGAQDEGVQVQGALCAEDMLAAQMASMERTGVVQEEGEGEGEKGGAAVKTEGAGGAGGEGGGGGGAGESLLMVKPERDSLIDTTQRYQRNFLSLVQMEMNHLEADCIERLKHRTLRQLEREGLCVTGLLPMPAGDIYGEKILDLSTGLGSVAPSLSVVGGGGKRGGDAFAKFNVGDLVLVTPGDRSPLDKKAISIEATVSEKCPGGQQLSLSCSAWPPGVWSGRRGNGGMGLITFRIDKFFSTVPYDRMKRALSELSPVGGGEFGMARPLQELLLNTPHNPRIVMPQVKKLSVDREEGRRASAALDEWASRPPQDSAWMEGGRDIQEVVRLISATRGLNPSQEVALSRALSRQCTLIQGPPGTGKTFTSACLIEALVALDERRPESEEASEQRRTRKILATAHSNVATDNIMERLLKAGVSVIRIGKVSTVAPGLRAMCLDALVERDDEVKKATQAMMLNQQGSLGYIQAREEVGRMREAAAVSILKAASVVVSSLIGSGHENSVRIMRDYGFRLSTVVADEASQATEPSTLIALSQGCSRLVLVGDHCQLPPTVASPTALKDGLGVSLLSRLVASGITPVRLQLQYRMHPVLAAFPSAKFYGSRLLSRPTDEDRPQMPGFDWPSDGLPIALVNVGGGKGGEGGEGGRVTWNERLSGDGRSISNPTEAGLIVQMVERLLKSGVDSSDIAVMSPYSAQVLLIKSLLENLVVDLRSDWGDAATKRGGGIEVNSVDGFQGREKDIVILSTARSNPTGTMGFLTDWRRLNVAITRARRGLIVVGDGSTLQADPTWCEYLEYIRGEGGAISADDVERQLREWRGLEEGGEGGEGGEGEEKGADTECC